MPSYADGILPPLPGITPYTCAFNVAYKAFDMVFGLRYDPRPDLYFNGVTIDLMPKALSKGKMLSVGETSQIMNKMYPAWRRFANIERYAVPQNEFTVWETAPPASPACCLTTGSRRRIGKMKNRRRVSMRWKAIFFSRKK